ncbi:MAG: hypothetical protein K6E47_14470 [Lachnospiraceae bacterium]|nr:hypothetical protein [Lachnospiraceae bacterium]
MKKKINLASELVMYMALLTQMLYVIVGNVVHEILGIVFFIGLVVHIVIKRYWFKAVFRNPDKKPASRKFADAVTILLLVTACVLMISSMGVSRTLFPWFKFMMEPLFHRYLATAVLTLSLVHGGMHFYFKAKSKKKAVILISILAILGLAIGLALVPYLNRHLRKVDIIMEEKVSGEKVEVTGDKPLVVYFTRLGNTDFDDDVDAVSGASLMRSGETLIGNTELLAYMIRDAIGSEIVPITLTGEKYPSSYTDTVSVGGRELREDARPEIEDIDVSGYSEIILIYPIWWGTVPMPVATFLEGNDFSGKTIYLIATQGSAGFGSSTSFVREKAEGADVIEVMSIYCDDIPDSRVDIVNWLKSTLSLDEEQQ